MKGDIRYLLTPWYSRLDLWVTQIHEPKHLHIKSWAGIQPSYYQVTVWTVHLCARKEYPNHWTLHKTQPIINNQDLGHNDKICVWIQKIVRRGPEKETIKTPEGWKMKESQSKIDLQPCCPVCGILNKP